jgi:hypothetical protein
MGKGTYTTAEPLRDDPSVAGMVDEDLERWAKTRAVGIGDSFKNALAAILGTEAGRQLREVGSGSGPHRREKADERRANVAEERADALGQRSTPKASDLSTGGGGQRGWARPGRVYPSPKPGSAYR